MFKKYINMIYLYYYKNIIFEVQKYYFFYIIIKMIYLKCYYNNFKLAKK